MKQHAGATISRILAVVLISGMIPLFAQPVNNDMEAKIAMDIQTQDVEYTADGQTCQGYAAAFKAIMERAVANDIFVELANTVHSFTQPKPGNDPPTGSAYNETSDTFSWMFMKDFWKTNL